MPNTFVFPLVALNAAKYMSICEINNLVYDISRSEYSAIDKTTGEIRIWKITFFDSGLFPFNEVYQLLPKFNMRYGVSRIGNVYFKGNYFVKMKIDNGDLVVSFV